MEAPDMCLGLQFILNTLKAAAGMYIEGGTRRKFPCERLTFDEAPVISPMKQNLATKTEQCI
ncbi:unnamed protein product [Sphenostylis stenocarpa]|uniref:Uncharacterized protein n=1 Tax=Sphenostylis stenocarpa TaxID=92480 RepID=A0AA87B984_9FABA|nr:unnamed protein product [Sphenostylis stenocarpa]